MFTSKFRILCISLIWMVLGMMSCSESAPKLELDLSGTPMQEVKIRRYEQLMFQIPADSFFTVLPRYAAEFPLFIDAEQLDTPSVNNLIDFFSDGYMRELNAMVQTQYPDLASVEKELSKGFQYFKYYYPQTGNFVIYSYISGMDADFPVKILDSNLVIGLDMFLGAETKVYGMSGFPKYVSHWFTAERIVPEVFSEMAVALMPAQDASQDLLHQMVYEGKRLYFMKSMMPHVSDSLLLKYTSSQWEWAVKYEAKLWAMMVENQFLFKTDLQIRKKFLEDAPFTAILDTDAPARLGEFIGYRLVTRYMTKTQSSLPQLMEFSEAHQILKDSKYKPR